MFLMLKYPKEANLTVISNTLWSLIDEEGGGWIGIVGAVGKLMKNAFF